MADTVDYAKQAADLYQTNLGRAGDKEGTDYWTAQLASGRTLEDVGKSFKDAAKQVEAEYAANPVKYTNDNPTKAAFVSQDFNTAGNGKLSLKQDIADDIGYQAPVDYAAQAANLYQQNLGRAGDKEGMDYWTAQLASGRSLDDVGKSFKDSAKQVEAEYASNPQAWAAKNAGTAAFLAQDYVVDAKGNLVLKQNIQNNLGIVGGGMAKTEDKKANQTTAGGGSSSLALQIGNTSTYLPGKLAAPAVYQVTPNQTVQGQMQNMIDPNNPYFQAWSTAGKQMAAANGFTNGSMQQSGILNSIMQNATPIASADAGTYSRAAGYNVDQLNQTALNQFNADNTAGQFNAGQRNLTSQANLNAATSITNNAANNATNIFTNAANNKQSGENTAANNATTLATANISAGTQRFASQLSADTQVKLAGINNTSQEAISKAHDANAVLLSDNSEKGAAARTAMTTLINGIASIQVQPTMDATAKQTAINNLIDTFNASLSGKGFSQDMAVGTASTVAAKASADYDKALEAAKGDKTAPAVKAALKAKNKANYEKELYLAGNDATAPAVVAAKLVVDTADAAEAAAATVDVSKEVSFDVVGGTQTKKEDKKNP